jgi:mannose-1-phosphate guanylyltransferase
MNPNNYCVIMAGGVGSRFWPVSKTAKPKQFLDILGLGRTFLQMTFDRFSKICPVENIFVVTNDLYTKLVAEQLPELHAEQILSEPMRRNTAPCIAYANMKIRMKNHDANIVVAPSDHLITNEAEFLKIIEQALNFTKETDALVTLGLKPTRPETGYGYIQISHQPYSEKHKTVQKVQSFTEKPDYEVAKQFMESGEFFWNSGIFIWSLSSISRAFETYQQDIASLFMPGMEIATPEAERDFITAAYAECKNISVDKGIMENADNVYVICGDFGWSDLGTWDSLYENSKKNESNDVLIGNNIMTYETKNILVKVPNNKLVVLQGLEDFIVAESDDMLLVCRRNDERKIRDIVNDIQLKKGNEYV